MSCQKVSSAQGRGLERLQGMFARLFPASPHICIDYRITKRDHLPKTPINIACQCGILLFKLGFCAKRTFFLCQYFVKTPKTLDNWGKHPHDPNKNEDNAVLQYCVAGQFTGKNCRYHTPVILLSQGCHEEMFRVNETLVSAVQRGIHRPLL